MTTETEPTHLDKVRELLALLKDEIAAEAKRPDRRSHLDVLLEQLKLFRR